jgi:hypothetical protein
MRGLFLSCFPTNILYEYFVVRKSGTWHKYIPIHIYIFYLIFNNNNDNINNNNFYLIFQCEEVK